MSGELVPATADPAKTLDTSCQEKKLSLILQDLAIIPRVVGTLGRPCNKSLSVAAVAMTGQVPDEKLKETRDCRLKSLFPNLNAPRRRTVFCGKAS
jgi:hypothetical protein